MFSLNISSIDAAIISAYLLLCIVFGTLKKVRANTLKEFAVGSGDMSMFVLVIMIFATYIGAGSTVGEVERVYKLGVFYAFTRMVSPLFWLLNAWIFADRLEKFANCLSLPDVIEVMYGKTARKISVVMSFLTCIGFVAAQLAALGFLSSYLLGIPKMTGILIGSLVVVIYIAAGGAKALVVNDMFQFCIFYIGIPILCAIVLQEVHGFEGLMAVLPKEMFQLDLQGTEKWVFISLIFYAMLPTTHATFVQRFLMARNTKNLRRSLYYIAFINLPFALVILLIGFCAKAIAPNIEPNHTLYYLIANYLPVGMVGLLISGILAVIMSTAHSWLNSTSVIFAEDIVQIFKKDVTEKQKLFAARASTIVIMIVAALLAGQKHGVMQLLWLAENMWEPVMMVPIIMGFKGINASGRTFMISFIVSSAVTGVTAYQSGEFNTLSIFLGICSCILSFTIAHLLEKPYSMMRIRSEKSWVSKLADAVISFNNQRYFIKRNFMIFSVFVIFQYIPSMLEASMSESMGSWFNIGLRSCSVFLVVLFLGFEYWPKGMQKKFVMPIWNINLLFTLAYSPSLLLLMSENKVIWVLNLFLCFVLLTFFIKTFRAAAIFVFGSVLAMITYNALDLSVVGLAIGSIYMQLTIASIYGIIAFILVMVVMYSFDTDVSFATNTTGFIAHEVKSPFASLNMSANQLLEIFADAKVKKTKSKANIELGAEEFALMHVILSNLTKSTQKGIEVVNGILGATTSDNRSLALILDELVKLFDDSRISVVVNHDYNIKKSKEVLVMIVDNLLRNAVKYSKATNIVVTLDKDKLSVEDDGVGIPAHLEKTIFDFGSTTAGHGMGLALVKRLVDENNWQLYYSKNKKGKGVKFSLYGFVK